MIFKIKDISVLYKGQGRKGLNKGQLATLA